MKRLTKAARAHLLRLAGASVASIERQHEAEIRMARFTGLDIVQSDYVPMGEAWLISSGRRVAINPRTPKTVFALSRIAVVRNLGFVR